MAEESSRRMEIASSNSLRASAVWPCLASSNPSPLAASPFLRIDCERAAVQTLGFRGVAQFLLRLRGVEQQHTDGVGPERQRLW